MFVFNHIFMFIFQLYSCNICLQWKDMLLPRRQQKSLVLLMLQNERWKLVQVCQLTETNKYKLSMIQDRN